MSITIIQEPQEVTPAYNPINYVVSSTNIAQPSFQYVFDLYVNDTFISRHRLPPKTITGIARLDVSGIVQSYVTHDIDLSSTAFDRNPNSWASVYVRFGEEYSVAGTITTYVNLLDSETCYAVNASLEYLSFAGWSSNSFYQGSTRKFLTSIARPKVLDNTKLWLSFYHELPENIDFVRIRVYDSSESILAVSTYVPTDLSNSDIGDRFLRISVGTDQLKQIFSNPNFFNGGSYYTVELVDSTSSFQFETKRIDLQEQNCKYTNVPVHFLNVHGAFDVFNFKLASTKDSVIERKKYNVNTGSFNGSDEFIYSVSDRSSQAMSIASQDSMTVNSDWISEEESVWLKELITSPVVFVEQAGQLIPIQITDTRYKFAKTVNDKVFNLQMSFTFGNENYRQSY